MKRTHASLFLLICGLALPLAAGTQSHSAAAPADARRADLHGKLARQLEQIAAEFDGVMGIAAKDVTTGETFQVNAAAVFPQASSIKIAILVELFRQAQAGTLRLEERVELKRVQMAGGSGVLQHFGDATSAISLRDLAVLMIVLSDNTATNLLIERLGMTSVNNSLDRFGLTETRLQRRMMDTDAQRASRENLSTPREMAALLELLQQGKLLDPAGTAAVIQILSYRKNSPLRRGLPESVAVADKPGGIDGVRCDSGIVLLATRPYTVSVMTTYIGDSEAAERAISEVSRRLFAYFERLARSNAHGARLP